MLRKYLGKALSKTRDLLDLRNPSLINIEGGLGSQILSIMAFWNLQEEIGEIRARCDLSYFKNSQGNDLWKWGLDRFGIEREMLRKWERHKLRDRILIKADFLSGEQLNEEYWSILRSRYAKLFPYDASETTKYFSTKYSLILDEHFGAVHIRRGDYLKVASKVVTIKNYVRLITQIKELFPSQVLVFSDSELSETEKLEIELAFGKNTSRRINFLDDSEIDPFHAHCLMRQAQLLVTSNSTFSFSAGLLSISEQRTFSPMEFHSGENALKYNRGFRTSGEFFVWSQK